MNTAIGCKKCSYKFGEIEEILDSYGYDEKNASLCNSGIDI